MKKILVRADDLGYSEGVNYGLAKSVKDGIIRSVGIMPNMPAAAEGLALLKGVKVCYGQHTNICVGKPLCNPKDVPSLVGEDGNFKTSREYRAAYQEGRDFVVLDEIVAEIEAQYVRYKELVGDEPHYFEAHAVQSDNLAKGLEIVAERHHLPYLPAAFTGAVRFRNTMLHPCLESMKPDYDPFASLQKVAAEEYDDGGVAMFVCHPGYLDDFILKTSSLTIPRTLEVEMSIAPRTREWLEENEITVITYDDLD